MRLEYIIGTMRYVYSIFVTRNVKCYNGIFWTPKHPQNYYHFVWTLSCPGLPYFLLIESFYFFKYSNFR